MKTYANMKSTMLYKQNGCPLPKGEHVGKGNAVFLLEPSRIRGYDTIRGEFIQYKKGLYKKYLIDYVYKDRVGYKKVLQNKTGVFKKEFTDNKDVFTSLAPITNGNRASMLKQKYNVLVNMGHWNEIYFQYQLKGSVAAVCSNYLDFLHNHICSQEFSEYNKVIYIDVDHWFGEKMQLGFSRKNLVNPIAIFLVAARRFPVALHKLTDCSFLFVSSSNQCAMKVELKDVSEKTYHIIKQRIMSMITKEWINDSDCMDDDDTVMKEDMSTDEIVSSIVEDNKESENQQRMRKAIMANLTKDLLGESDDITEEEGFEDDPSDDEPISTDNEKIREMQNMADDYIDKHPELLKADITTASDEVKSVIKKKYYVREYQPKYTNKQLEKVQELAKQQVESIGDIGESFQDLESKVIDVSDISDVTDTHNPNIVQTRFNNFDRSYVKKKLSKDIDNSVGHLANAAIKVFVVGKEEEDSSTQRDIKKTMTYHLVDENGKKMTLKFDVPIVIDDHFLYLNGNKKMFQYQFVLKPIVKTGKDAVQIVSNYKKMRITRQGANDVKTSALMKYLTTNADTYNVSSGNAYAINRKYKTTLEFDSIAKKILSFQIDGKHIILDIPRLIATLEKKKIPNNVDMEKNLIVGYDSVEKKVLSIPLNDSFCDFILGLMKSEERINVERMSKKSNGSKGLSYSKVTILNKGCPLILLLLYFEGFSTVMKKAGIEYAIIDKVNGKPVEDVDLYEWGLTELENGFIKWKRYPSENSTLMNGLNSLPMYLYGKEELDSKNTYMYLMTNIYSYANQAFNLDQFYDFMIDPVTKEILIDLKLPTDLVSLCILANKMLKGNEHSQESDMHNVRLRSSEVIQYHVYQAITDAYRNYRTRQYGGKVRPITMKQDDVIKRLLKQPASVLTDASVCHPVMDASKLHSVSYKGESGLNMDRAYNMNIRAYNETMLGILGITTTNDANVGIKRQLTLNPHITSTRGYIDVGGTENLDNMNSGELLTPMEMLTPLGVQHDDPTRTTMAFKQTTNMVPTHKSDAVLIGNGMEKALPYHISSEFTIIAEDDGIIVDKNDDFVVMKYNNGRFRTIKLSPQMKKNSSAGSYVMTSMTCKKEIGEKVRKNEVVAWDIATFEGDPDGKGCSMKTGPFVKIAIVPEWDCYEDSAPISSNAAKKLTSTVVMPIEVMLTKDAYISEAKKIGDPVEAGESVIRYDNYREDPEMVEILKSLREELDEEIIESSQTTEKSHFTGKIVDIKIVSSVPLEEMSDSCRKFVTKYWNREKKKIKFLDKYSNEDDMKYYKSGNIIQNSPEPVDPENLKYEGIIVTFFVAYDDVMSRGDKLASEFALKSIDSHVIEEGLEPRSEYKPEEPIDLVVPPLSITARKTPSIFLAMFGNKILIYAKDHLREYWESN